MAAASNVQGADKGMDYQYQVMTYILASLRKNTHIKDFIFFANLENAGKFDDIVMKIWFEKERHPYVYEIQVKHKSIGSLDISDNKSKIGITAYVNSFQDIMDAKAKITYLEDVPEENIKFWLFCNANLQEVRVYTAGQNKRTKYRFSCVLNKFDDTSVTIVPVEEIKGSCYKLSSNENEEKYQNFFKKFYLFLNQPNNEEIGEEIKTISGVTDSAISKYVEKYFKTDEVWDKGLTKKIFELELLLIKLSTYMPVLSTGTLETIARYAEIWHKITLEHDVTIVANAENMDRLVYDCCLKKVDGLFGQAFDWNYYLKTQAQLDEPIVERFKSFVASKKFRHWLAEPRTVQCLLKELWIYDEVPLILDTNGDLLVLDEFMSLRKKYIVISDLEKMRAKFEKFDLKMCTNISDISNDSLKEELLKSISISLQGRKPVPLQSIIGKDINSWRALTCSELLNLIMKRSVYLGKNFIADTEFIIFVIEDTNSQTKWARTDKIHPNDQGNIVITCQNFEETTNYFSKLIQEDNNFRHYSLCRLRLENNKFKFVDGDLDKLRHFFVDEREKDIYIADVEEPVPIIGERLCRRIPLYMPRYLSKSDVLETVLDAQVRQIFFVSGDVDSLASDIKNQIQKYPVDEDTDVDLEKGNGAFIDVEGVLEDYWSLFASEDYQLVHVKVVDGCFILMEHRNCTKMVSYTAYGSDEFREGDFSKEMNNKVIVLNGETGIGKSALLQSLVETSDGANYVLYCNLADLGDELKLDKELLQSPLKLLFDKYESSACRTLLDSIFRYHKDGGRLTIFIDSLDDMLPFAPCKDKALVFMRNIAESGVNVVVTSTIISGNLLMNNLLLNNIKVQPFRINYLKTDDAHIYFKGKGVFDFDSHQIPSQFLLNPLHLEFLYFYRNKDALDFASCDKSDLCKKIIMKNIEQYYRRVNQPYVFGNETANETQNEDILEVHRYMALAQMFGTGFLTEYAPRKYDKLVKEFQDIKIRLGIVKGFKDNCPRFTNRVLLEFLVKQWFMQHQLDETVRRILIEDYNKIAEHFSLSPEELKSKEEDDDTLRTEYN